MLGRHTVLPRYAAAADKQIEVAVCVKIERYDDGSVEAGGRQCLVVSCKKTLAVVEVQPRIEQAGTRRAVVAAGTDC